MAGRMTSAYERQVAGNHYKTMKIQPITFIIANELGWCEGNIVKYICRWKAKGGLEDLKKVQHYLDILIEDHEQGNDRDTIQAAPGNQTQEPHRQGPRDGKVSPTSYFREEEERDL